MTDPRDLGDAEVERLLLDLTKADLQLIEQWAFFKNAVADAQEKLLKRQWSRKSMAEQFISDQCEILRDQLKGMWAEVGPFPEFSKDKTDKAAQQAANRAAMEKYAKRVVELAEKKRK